MLNQARAFYQKQPQFTACLLIFSVSLFVYLINGKTLSSNDNIPNSLLAFNLLVKHTLNFDAFRGSYLYGPGGECVTCRTGIPYYFVEAPNGHLTSTYPIGTAIVTFPLYFLFFVYLKLTTLVQTLFSGEPSAILNITHADFALYRERFEKLAASMITAFSVVFFYLAARLKFSPWVSAVSTIIFAVATPTWVIISQGLRQHTASNFILTIILFCLLAANRQQSDRRRILLLIAGVGCGLLPGIRITSLLFAIAATLYAIYVYRKESFFLLLGLSSAGFNIAWNFYFFGFSVRNILVGGYASLFQNGASSYNVSAPYFLEAAAGLLVSPSDGFLFYSPILLFAISGGYYLLRCRLYNFLLKLRLQAAFHGGHASQIPLNKGLESNDDQLLASLLLACFVFYLHYSVYVPWTGGSDSFGSRFMTDTLPIVCYAIGYSLVDIEPIWHRHRARLSYRLIPLFLGILLSILVQIIGVVSPSQWGTIPMPIGMDRSRLWNLHDSQIFRQINTIFFDVTDPIHDAKSYLQKMAGVIEQITDKDGQPLPDPMVRRPWRRMTLKAKLRNTGKEQWFGYETGMGKGETRIQGEFFDSHGKWVKTASKNLLYVSGIPQPGSTAEAIGFIACPRSPGTYKLIFRLMVEKVGNFPESTTLPYTLSLNVRN